MKRIASRPSNSEDETIFYEDGTVAKNILCDGEIIGNVDELWSEDIHNDMEVYCCVDVKVEIQEKLQIIKCRIYAVEYDDPFFLKKLYPGIKIKLGIRLNGPNKGDAFFDPIRTLQLWEKETYDEIAKYSLELDKDVNEQRNNFGEIEYTPNPFQREEIKDEMRVMLDSIIKKNIDPNRKGTMGEAIRTLQIIFDFTEDYRMVFLGKNLSFSRDEIEKICDEVYSEAKLKYLDVME